MNYPPLSAKTIHKEVLMKKLPIQFFGVLLIVSMLSTFVFYTQSSASARPTSTIEPTAKETTPLAPIAGIGQYASPMPFDPASAQLTTTINLKVRKTGIYRLTYEMLRDAGLDLAGVPITKITVLNRGKMTPVYTYAADKTESFGLGSFIEFYGEALDTIYTDTNIYTVQVSNAPVSKIPLIDARPDMKLVSPVSYTETLLVNNQIIYATSAPGSDAWYDTRMLAYTTPKSWDFSFQINGLVDAPSTLKLTALGLISYSHHLVISLNGVLIADQRFDGIVVQNVMVDIPAGTLIEGANTLQLTIPGDSGMPYDMVALDKYQINYQRAFKAQSSRLTFTSLGDLFTVIDLPSQNVIAYTLRNGGLARLENFNVQANGTTFSASFAGTTQADTYLLTTKEALYTPDLEAVRWKTDLSHSAEYLIISHPDFITGLGSLVQARQAQGLTVSVVDVNDLYTQYSYGIFDPQAIQKYIAYAAQNLGTRYVLLVGGDTYDYRNYLRYDSISFIPSLYIATDPLDKLTPSDPLYADVNSDNIPDLAIGRFPVRTSAELSMLIGKTLAYAAKSYNRTAVFTSDLADGSASFRTISNNLAAGLSSDWAVESIHMDDLGGAAAKMQLLAAMNRGTALINFNGHSSPSSWTNSNLFTTSDAAALTNTGKPFVAVQWGCWTTYYVDPANNYLVQNFLFSGDNGAAAVLGGTTLIYFGSEELFAPLLMPRLATPGMTVGQALQDAKVQLAQTEPGLKDILLGWTLMGDPALVIEP
jgi:hypothetical protein